MKVATVERAPWLRQFGAVLMVELRRVLWTRRATPLLLLAGMPVAATLVAALFAPPVQVFHTLIGVGVFFGAAATQTKLLRGEIVAHTLHYHLLAPISRETLLVGKYLAGFAGTGGVFVAATAVCYGVQDVLDAELLAAVGDDGPPLSAALAVVVLGCAAYGAVFLLFGALFRNPVLPVAGLLIWELAHFVLPPTLQTFSVAHHLQRVLDDATAAPAWLSTLTLLALVVVALVLACRRLRRLEIG